MTDTKPHTGSRAKKIVTDTVKFILPIAVTVVLVVWLFRKVNFASMMHIIDTECEFSWVFLMMVVSVISHVIRGIRWGIQLRGAGLPRVPVMVESVSIFGAYALNLIVPLLGEGWRCVYMARREKAPLATVVGTDLGDRFSDALAISVLIGVALIVARDKIMTFIDRYAVGEKLMHLLGDFWLWAAVIGAIALFIGVCWLFRNTKFVQGMWASFLKIWNGFRILFTMKHGFEYLLLTVGIWVCYYLETYLCFFAFPFTRELITQTGSCWGLIPGLIAFVFGSISIAVPSNGGLGPWNIAVIFALSLYGVSYTDAMAYTMVLWAFKSLTLVLLGIYSCGYIMARSRRKDTSN